MQPLLVSNLRAQSNETPCVYHKSLEQLAPLLRPSCDRVLHARVQSLTACASKCRQEEVTREEVVLDKETITQPTTVMKPIKTEVPELIESKKAVAQLHEEMRTLTVVRPRTEMQKVKVMRPVEKQQTVTGAAVARTLLLCDARMLVCRRPKAHAK